MNLNEEDVKKAAKVVKVKAGEAFFIVHWEMDSLFGVISPGNVVGNVKFSFGQQVRALYADQEYDATCFPGY